jgi:hypothetical protein
VSAACILSATDLSKSLVFDMFNRSSKNGSKNIIYGSNTEGLKTSTPKKSSQGRNLTQYVGMWVRLVTDNYGWHSGSYLQHSYRVVTVCY